MHNSNQYASLSFATVVYDKIFRIIDTDRNGSISSKEWKIHCIAINISADYSNESFNNAMLLMQMERSRVMSFLTLLRIFSYKWW